MRLSNLVEYIYGGADHPEVDTEKIWGVIQSLGENHYKVMCCRFDRDTGLLTGRTYSDIASEFNVSQTRIQQVINNIIKKLRHPYNRSKIEPSYGLVVCPNCGHKFKK